MKKDLGTTRPPVFLTVWQDAWIAITQPRQYLRWAFQPFKRSVAYLAILVAVMSVVATIYFFMTIKPAVEEAFIWAEDAVPQITVKNEQLFIEDDETFTFTDGDQFFFKVDPTITKDDEASIDTFYEAGMLITKDEVITRSEGGVERIAISETGLEGFSVNGQQLKAWSDSYLTITGLLAVPILTFLYLFLSKLLYSAFFSVIAYLFGGMRQNLVHLWSMSIYALTPAIVTSYLLFMFYRVMGVSTLVFVVYFILALGHYTRFTMSKRKLG